MAFPQDTANAVLVQAYKHLPWLGRRWARGHRFVESRDIPWARPLKPLSESVVALVTTAGVHLRSQEPFDMHDPDGDPSFRAIPAGVQSGDLTITHKYYDHTAADRDMNVVFPLDRLRDLCAERRIGGMGPIAYGFLGHIDGPRLRILMESTAPEVARRLKAEGIDAVVLTPA
jgi:D-proline reductase (dithiol) PrdB